MMQYVGWFPQLIGLREKIQENSMDQPMATNEIETTVQIVMAWGTLEGTSGRRLYGSTEIWDLRGHI